jgi:Spy/CpxP family protein refolding chaperone
MAMRDGKARMGIQDGKSRLNTVLVLSEDQQEKLSSMRLDHQKDMRYQQNLLGEKNASLKTLLSAPERDKVAIDKTIDDISLMKGELMKKQIANRDEMKSILSPEQVEKLESLGYWKSMRQGVRGKRTPSMRDGQRGGNDSRVGRRDFHGRGFGQPSS